MRRLQFQKAGTPRMSRRGFVLLGAKLAVIGGLGWRMRQLQVENTNQYRLLAEENRINIRLLPPARGLIFDRNGKQLAINRQNYRVVMIREQAGDPSEALDRLGKLIPITEQQRTRVLKEMRQKSAFVPVAVAEHLEWEAFAKVAANGPALPGVIPEVGLTRFYPETDLTAHIVGYVGPVSDKDLQNQDDQDPLLQIPRFQIGKTGVEKLAESSLRGQAGISRIEVNSLGRIMRELDRTEGTAGTNIQLTLDLDLQRFALDRMRNESAAAVVMDLKSGDLVALASSPVFDPNLFVFGISTDDWNGLLNDPYRPLANKTVSGLYPPGSTFKMVVALAALREGLVSPGEKIWCPGYMEVGNRRFHCWRRGGHGQVNLKQSLKASCDVFYYEMAKRVGIEKITEMAKELGLGQRHDLPLPAVYRGLTPTKEWKQREHDSAWLVGDSVNAGIGQGYVLASPLQLAVMTARLATGKAVTPRLVRATSGTPLPVPEFPALNLSENDLQEVRRGLYAVTNERRGTGYGSRIHAAEMIMAGKTGTSQVRQITMAERQNGVFRNEDLPWNRRDHALFVAYAPFDKPRYSISVVVEHGGGGSKAAAPIARDILLQALYNGTPPLTAYPPAKRKTIKREREERRREAPAATPTVRDRA